MFLPPSHENNEIIFSILWVKKHKLNFIEGMLTSFMNRRMAQDTIWERSIGNSMIFGKDVPGHLSVIN